MADNTDNTTSHYLNNAAVCKRYGIGNTTLYRWMNCSNIRFPRPIQFGLRAVRWKLEDLKTWEVEQASK